MNIKNIKLTNKCLLVIGSLLVGFGSGATLDSYLADLANTEKAPTMQHEMDAMTSVLKGKTGDAFDKAFLEEMVIHDRRRHRHGKPSYELAALANGKLAKITSVEAGRN